MKKCKKCGEEKKIEFFVKSSKCRDGYRNCCKECWSKKSKKYYLEKRDTVWKESRKKNREKKKVWDKKYRETHKEIIKSVWKIWYRDRNQDQIQKTREIARNFRKTEKAKTWQIQYKKREEVRILANTTLNNAVRDGKLVRPKNCSICDREGKIEGHHANYDKPLEVVWVCKECHVMIHKNLKKETK